MTESHNAPHGAHHPHREPERSNTVKMLVNVLTIVGLIILIVIVIWGLLHLARLSSGWFSGWFSSKPTNSITVTAPTSVTSGSPFALSWTYETDQAGNYALIYKCEDGLQFAVPTNSGTFQSVPCGTSYALGTTTKTAVLPILAASTSIKSVISVLFLPQGGQTGTPAQGSANVTVNPGTTPVPVTEKPDATDKPTPKPTGTPDLAVTIVAVGVIDQNGNFVQRAPVSGYETAAVQFDVANVGSGTSGSYTFTAQLPTSQPYTYQSPVQAPLAAGSHVVNTLRFTQAVSGTFMVSLNGDANTNNNYASQYVNAPYQLQYNPGYQYIPPYYQY